VFEVNSDRLPRPPRPAFPESIVVGVSVGASGTAGLGTGGGATGAGAATGAGGGGGVDLLPKHIFHSPLI
jgi:hypothetical protein